MAFNVQQFVLNFSNKLLAQSGGGGFRDFEGMKREIRANIALARRRKVEATRGAFGSQNIQSTATLFSEGVAEGQAAEAERSALTNAAERDAQLRNTATAQAQRTALGAAPIAQEEANRPSFIEKVGGALIGGAMQHFLPVIAGKLFPSPEVGGKSPSGDTGSTPTAPPIPQNPTLPSVPSMPSGIVANPPMSGGMSSMDGDFLNSLSPEQLRAIIMKNESQF